MKKSEIREIFEKFIESFPDDETEVAEGIIISKEKIETIRKIDENGNTVVERKEIYVDENTGEYMYR